MAMNEKIRLIIDTDPGQDDAAAILAAHGLARRGLVDFLGMTVVAGNVGMDLTAKNARIICDWAGEEDFPVYAGAVKPLLRGLETAEAVHGKRAWTVRRCTNRAVLCKSSTRLPI